MAYEFRLPDLGEGIAEGEIVKWIVKEGDKVEEHQAIVEIHTDKAVVQVPSPKAGTILKATGAPGDVIHVGDVLAVIGEEGEKPAKDVELKPKAAPKKTSSTVIGELEEAPEEDEVKKVAPPAKTAEPSVSALPAVRKLAKDMGVDLSQVKGSGPGGRITEDDVRQGSGKVVKEKPKAVHVTFEQFGRVLRIPLKGVRKKIAENMTRSLSTAAHVTHMDYIDVTKLAAFRAKEKKIAEEKGIKLTYLPFIVKACILALKEFPYMNSSLDDENGEIVIKQYYNIGIAVDAPQGLMVPVVHHANEKTIFEIAKDIWRVAESCRTQEIKLKDLQGGTFTITNVGSLGGVFATPVINYPECAILALGRMKDTPVAIDGKFEVRKMLPVSLSFDHRIVDGAMAAKFVNKIKKDLEEPDNLFMGF